MELRDEQAYGRFLQWGTTIGLVLLALSFAAYLAGILPSYTPPSALPELWQVPVSRYLEVTGSPTGWRWLSLLHNGDYLTVGAITLLSLVTPLCYLQLALSLAARRRTVFALMAALQLVIFAAAAALGFF